MGSFNVFPACAGVIPARVKLVKALPRISRMRGGDPVALTILEENIGYFPHARG